MTTPDAPVLDLDAIAARADAATQGPWEYECGSVLLDDCEWFRNAEPDYESTPQDDANGLLMAHARTDVPALVAEVRRLRAEVDYLEHALDHLRLEREL